MDKRNDYNELLKEIISNAEASLKATEFDIQMEIAATMRELRQSFERLRRLRDNIACDDSQDEKGFFDSLELDELRFAACQFAAWSENEFCPRSWCQAFRCQAFPCDWSTQPDFKEKDCNVHCPLGQQEGCWLKYYVWCYRNHIDPREWIRDRVGSMKHEA